MKELEVKKDINIEVSIKQKKQVEHELVGQILPYRGHIIWQINNKTFEITKAEFSNTTYQYGKENKKEIQMKEGFSYVSAINKNNALKKFKQGRNGGVPIEKEICKLF